MRCQWMFQHLTCRKYSNPLGMHHPAALAVKGIHSCAVGRASVSTRANVTWEMSAVTAILVGIARSKVWTSVRGKKYKRWTLEGIDKYHFFISLIFLQQRKWNIISLFIRQINLAAHMVHLHGCCHTNKKLTTEFT